jgi:hypothetical protein
MGGHLMLDFFDPDVDALSKGKLVEKAEFEDSDGGKIFAEWTWHYDLASQMAHLHCRVKGRNRPSKEMDVRIRYIFPGEFMNLLESCGFKKWKLYGGFNYERYERNGQELVWVAEK